MLCMIPSCGVLHLTLRLHQLEILSKVPGCAPGAKKAKEHTWPSWRYGLIRDTFKAEDFGLALVLTLDGWLMR